jgi:hypothetical protein
MSMPARMAWYRNTEWIASRTGLLPRNEKDTLETPPETFACGQLCTDPARRLDEVDGVVVVLLDTGATAKMFGSKMMSSGLKADRRVSSVGACADLDLAPLQRCRPGPPRRRPSRQRPRRSAGSSRACSRNSSSPSLRLIELTMALPCTQRRPASITSHLEESIMTGTRAMSGSAAIRLRKVTIASRASSMPSSMLTSMICAPFSTCSARRPAPWRSHRRGSAS